MKTPDEIKKDLQHCSQRTQLHCLGCSHDGESFCTHKLTADALAYIQQLELELDEIEKDRDAWRNAALRWNGGAE